MRVITFLSLFMLMGCDPYKFGFKLNPANILHSAFEAIQDSDKEKFLKVTGKEVLCLYGNDHGIDYLRKHATISPSDVKLKLTFVKETYHKNPQYVGYWSYLNQRYTMDVSDERDEKLLLQAVVDCDFGSETEKHERFQNLKRNKYERKECRLVKIIPRTFSPLKMNPRCQVLRVTV